MKQLLTACLWLARLGWNHGVNVQRGRDGHLGHWGTEGGCNGACNRRPRWAARAGDVWITKRVECEWPWQRPCRSVSVPLCLKVSFSLVLPAVSVEYLRALYTCFRRYEYRTMSARTQKAIRIPSSHRVEFTTIAMSCASAVQQ